MNLVPTSRSRFHALAWISAALVLPATTMAAQPTLPGGDSASFRPGDPVRAADTPPTLGEPNFSTSHGRRVTNVLHSKSIMPASAARALHVSSPFGWRHDPFLGGGRSHDGIDLPGRFGAPVHATGAGSVSFAGWMNGYGNLVQIDHPDGFRTRYGHLSRILVRDGQRVGAGEVVGAMGSTGRSTGTHLHYEIRRSGQPVNPLAYIGRGRAVSFGGASFDPQLDLVELGAAGSGHPVVSRWTGWTPSPDGLPQAKIR